MAGSGGRVLRSSDNPPRPTEESPNGPSHAESQVKKRPKPTPKKRGQHTDDAEKRSPAGAINRNTCDPVIPEHEQPQAHKRKKQAHPISVEGTRGQPMLPPPSSSPTLGQELMVVPHPNPLRNTPTGGHLSLTQPLPQVAATNQLSASTVGSIDAPRWPPTLPYPAIDQGKLPIFLPPPSHHQPVLQKDIPRTPPPSGGDSDPLILHPREINTIPRPRRISQKNLRAEMRLDATSDAKAYYSKIRGVIRGFMSDHFWLDWSKLTDIQKKTLFGKVFNDPRIPIIQRYQDNWATEEIAKTVASGRRKDAYSSGDATRPEKYAYNAINSSKRNPNAPRGRWNSISQSVEHEGKGKRARRTGKQTQDIGLHVPESPELANVNLCAPGTRSFPCSTLSGPQDAGPSQCIDPPAFAAFRPNEALPMYHSFQLSPPTPGNEMVAGLGHQADQYQRPRTQPTLQLLPHSVAEYKHVTPVSRAQPAPGQLDHQRLPPSMDDLYTFDVQNEHSEDEDNFYESEN